MILYRKFDGLRKPCMLTQSITIRSTSLRETPVPSVLLHDNTQCWALPEKMDKKNAKKAEWSKPERMKAKSSDRSCTQQLFKIAGRSPSNRRVRTNSVVESFNISKDIVLCLLPGAVVVQMNQLTFQTAEEVLRDSVVVGIALSGQIGRASCRERVCHRV